MAARRRGQPALRALPGSTAPAEQPAVIVCAWCQQSGRPQGAARERRTGRWRPVPHAYVRALTAAGVASHGLCTACAAIILQKIGA